MSEKILSSLEFVLKNGDFEELRSDHGLVIDLRYATNDNFVGYNLYGPFNRAFLHKHAAERLFKARDWLQRKNPGYTFVIYDALRPRCIQHILWSHVEGTDAEIYVAHPDRGSMHCFGMAIDLSVMDSNGHMLDMGAGFDDFREIAQPAHEDRFKAGGMLTDKHLENRLILRESMESAGFTSIRHEWWHFDAMDRAVVREKYTLVE